MTTEQDKEPVNEWNFLYPKNLAVVTTKRVIHREAPILRVSHDEEGWQFLDDGEIDIASAAVVGLYNATQRDPSLLDLADLPIGWEAWRESQDAPWQRRAGSWA